MFNAQSETVKINWHYYALDEIYLRGAKLLEVNAICLCPAMASQMAELRRKRRQR